MNRASSPAFALLASTFLASAGNARAQDSGLRLHPWADGAVIAGSAAALIASHALSSELAPKQCRWCEGNGLDDGARDAIRWPNARAAGGISDSIAFATLPVTVLGSVALAAHDDKKLSNVPQDVLVVAEATLVAMLLNQVAKLSVARQRPRVHALGDDSSRSAEPQDNLSFFSGHTTLAFSLATAAGTVATMRRYRYADWVWTSGLVLAASVGYLRMAADEHYFTDVATAALVGTSAGVAIPLLLHSPSLPVRVAPSPGGLSVVGVF